MEDLLRPVCISLVHQLCISLVHQYLHSSNSALADQFKAKYKPGVILKEVVSTLVRFPNSLGLHKRVGEPD